MGGPPLHSATPQYAIHVSLNSHDAAKFSQFTDASHSRGDMRQHIQVASGVFTVGSENTLPVSDFHPQVVTTILVFHSYAVSAPRSEFVSPL